MANQQQSLQRKFRCSDSILSGRLYHPRVFEGGKGAFLLESFDAFGGNGQSERLVELGHEDFLFLEIGKTPCLAARIELGGASPIGIPATDPTGFTCDCTCFSHNDKNAIILLVIMQSLKTQKTNFACVRP